MSMTVAKTALPNSGDPKAYLDGKPLNYSVTSLNDSWLITFSYLHSTHQIIVYLGNSSPSNQPFDIDYRVLAVVLTFLTMIIFGLLVYFKRHKH